MQSPRSFEFELYYYWKPKIIIIIIATAQCPRELRSQSDSYFMLNVPGFKWLSGVYGTKFLVHIFSIYGTRAPHSTTTIHPLLRWFIIFVRLGFNTYSSPKIINNYNAQRSYTYAFRGQTFICTRFSRHARPGIQHFSTEYNTSACVYNARRVSHSVSVRSHDPRRISK
jgi:hypothetical protein